LKSGNHSNLYRTIHSLESLIFSDVARSIWFIDIFFDKNMYQYKIKYRYKIIDKERKQHSDVVLVPNTNSLS